MRTLRCKQRDAQLTCGMRTWQLAFGSATLAFPFLSVSRRPTVALEGHIGEGSEAQRARTCRRNVRRSPGAHTETMCALRCKQRKERLDSHVACTHGNWPSDRPIWPSIVSVSVEGQRLYGKAKRVGRDDAQSARRCMHNVAQMDRQTHMQRTCAH